MSTDLHTASPVAAAQFPAFQITLSPEQRRVGLSVLRLVLLTITGAMPVLAIPAFVLGLADIHEIGLFALVPLTAVTALLALHGSAEARWAMRGLIAGLLAVTAYDALRMPFVLAGIWPDFIPRLGGPEHGPAAPSAPLNPYHMVVKRLRTRRRRRRVLCPSPG